MVVKDGGADQDKDLRDIIAEGCRRDRRVPVRREQADPVNREEDPACKHRDKKGQNLLSDFLPKDQMKQQQGACRDERPCPYDHCGRQIDSPHHRTEAAKAAHQQQKFIFPSCCAFVCFHRFGSPNAFRSLLPFLSRTAAHRKDRIVPISFGFSSSL